MWIPKSPSRRLHRQSFKTHDLQRVSCRTWSWSQAIVKNHSTVVHFFAEVIVCYSFNFVGQFDQFEIVSRNQTHCRSLRQCTYVRSTSNQSFTTVCAAEDFVDQKQHGQSVVHLRRC